MSILKLKTMCKKENYSELKLEMAFNAHLWVLNQIEKAKTKVDRINTGSISSVKQKLK